MSRQKVLHISDIDDGVILDATFKSKHTGELFDPTTITLTVIKPDGTSTNYVYGVDPDLTRLSLGKYTRTIITNAEGEWKVRWLGTGAMQSSENGIVVAKKPFG